MRSARVRSESREHSQKAALRGQLDLCEVLEARVLSCEAAEKNAQQLKGADSTVQKINAPRPSRKRVPGGCYGCGLRGRQVSLQGSHGCGKKGHINRACRSKRGGTVNQPSGLIQISNKLRRL